MKDANQQFWNTLRERWILSVRSKEKRRDLIIKNERGNVTLLLLVIFVGGILISLVFFDLFSIFVHRRIAQTGADAAALAAAMEMRKVYETELRKDLNTKIEELSARIEQLTNNIYDASWVEPVLDEDEEIISGGYHEKTREEAREEALDDLDVPVFLRDWLYNSQDELDAIEALLYFYKDNPNAITGIICTSVSGRIKEGLAAAKYFAKENGIDEEEVEIRFLPDNFEIFVEVKSKPTFTTIDQQPFENNRVHSSAAASIPFPDGIVFEQSYCN